MSGPRLPRWASKRRGWLPWLVLAIVVLCSQRMLRATSSNRQRPVAMPMPARPQQHLEPQPVPTPTPVAEHLDPPPESAPAPTTQQLEPRPAPAPDNTRTVPTPAAPPVATRPFRTRHTQPAVLAIARLTRWEWFKLRRRWMPWILLLILVLFSQLAIWATVFQYRQVTEGGNVLVNSSRRGGPESVSCANILVEPPVLPEGIDASLVPAFRAQCAEIAKQRDEQLRQIYANVSLPGSINLALSTPIGTILIAVLAASVIGVEYGWGTMRTTLTRGTGRMQYLTGKLAVLLLAALGALLVTAIGAAISSAIAQSFVISAPSGFVAASWASLFETIGRAWFALVPMIALLVMLTVLTASSATSMAIGIGYTIAEPIVLALLGRLFDRLSGASDYLLAANISGWSAGANPSASVSPLHHFVVLAIYTTLFTVTAFWLIRSRDVAKATGT